MTQACSPITPQPAALFQAWQQLRTEQPSLRAREAAARLGVSEGQLLAARVGIDAIALRPEWAEVLPALESLGYVMALTRNEYCVHERKGYYREVSVNANGLMGLVVSADIDLRLFLRGWKSLFALTEQTPRGPQRSLQVFDAQGRAVHKVFLTGQSDQAAWERLLERFRQPEQLTELPVQAAAPKAAPRPDAEVDQNALREGWAGLKDTHHFFSLINKHGAAREQALRLAGRTWAEPLDVAALPRLFEDAAAREVPIMVFVGNDHCIQIHSGTVNNLRWLDSWFNVMDPEFNLHLQTRGIHSLWRVRKPSSDGLITSWEAFDAEGQLVVQLFGARKPGMPELTAWRSLTEQEPAR